MHQKSSQPSRSLPRAVPFPLQLYKATEHRSSLPSHDWTPCTVAGAHIPNTNSGNTSGPRGECASLPELVDPELATQQQQRQEVQKPRIIPGITGRYLQIPHGLYELIAIAARCD